MERRLLLVVVLCLLLSVALIIALAVISSRDSTDAITGEMSQASFLGTSSKLCTNWLRH